MCYQPNCIHNARSVADLTGHMTRSCQDVSLEKADEVQLTTFYVSSAVLTALRDTPESAKGLLDLLNPYAIPIKYDFIP